MKRVFWIALGASAGVLIARQLRQSAQQLTPGTLVSGLGERAKSFWADVREAASARELELREEFGLDEPVTPTVARRDIPAVEATAPTDAAQPNSTD